MKRVLLIFISLIILCGCNDKSKNDFSNYEHYNLNGKDVIYHKYIDNNNLTHRYAIADITPDAYEISQYGLFYQISADDYILIDRIESTEKKENISIFYENKLYVISMGENPGNFEYTLNREKLEKKELNFKFSKGFLTRNIEKVKEDEIYYYALSNDDLTGNSTYIELKCSLSTYKCELNK